MEPRLTLLTLGVTDLKASRKFYEALGFETSASGNEDVVFFKTSGIVLALFGREDLAKDASVDSSGSGFRGFTIAHNVRNKEDVARVLEEARQVGAKIVKPAQDVFWGGHCGYFADPDGFLWEVAWNPHSPLNEKGEMTLR